VVVLVLFDDEKVCFVLIWGWSQLFEWISFLTTNLWGPPLTLQDCLQAFFQADELTGDNMYSCEKCGK